jgi:hypothetical protein
MYTFAAMQKKHTQGPERRIFRLLTGFWRVPG